MKVLITAKNKAADSEVDPRFGRAPYFAVYETEGDSINFVDNKQNVDAPSGAGIQAAANVAKTGAKIVITGNCGPKAFRTLSEANIKVIIGASGKISEAIEKFKKGKYKFASQSNVEGHW